MPFLPHASAFRRTAVVAALAVSFAGCSKSREKPAPSAELPLISAFTGLDSALTRAGNRTLVLDFYADWCKPCRVLAPVMRDLAGEFKGKADFYRVNVDASPSLASEFGVRGIPVVVFMKHDTAVYALTGVNPKERYAAILTACGGTGSAAECIARLKEGG